MTRSRASATTLAIAGLLVAGASGAQTPAPPARPVGTIRAVEQVLETRGAAVALPAAGIGTVTVTPCDTCRPITMLAGSSSSWMLGARAVGFDELRRALLAEPRARVLVFYRGPGAELTRLVAQLRGTPPP